LRTYDSRAACAIDQDKALANYRTAAETTRVELMSYKFLNDELTTTFHTEQGKIARMLRERTLCVPGTLDPRPRGKDGRIDFVTSDLARHRAPRLPWPRVVV